MKKAYIIIHEEIKNPDQANELLETITSTFISKKAKRNASIVIAENMEAKDVYDKLTSKITFSAEILVVELTNFYGQFMNATVIEWLKISLPHFNWFE
jgi:hypothetical protein